MPAFSRSAKSCFASSIPCSRVERHLAVVLEGLDRLLGHRVHGLGPDQLLDVHDVAVLGVLRGRRGPERPLRRRALGDQEVPGLAGEELLVALVGELGVGDRELPLELLVPAGLVEALVGLGVDTADEEAGHGCDRAGVAAAGHEPLQAADVGPRDLLVALEREDERDVDGLALRDHVLDRGEARLRRRDLHEEVRLVDELVQADGLGGRPLGVVGEVRVDLERDVSVLAGALVPHRPQKVERLVHVLHGEAQEDLLRVALLREHLAQLLVVGISGRDRLLEDRRIGRDADHGVLLHHPGELARVQHVAREEVDPDALTKLGELVQLALFSHVLPFLSRRAAACA